MDAKTNLINTLTIQLADSCNIPIIQLQSVIGNVLADYNVNYLGETLPSTGDGTATLYIFKKFLEYKFTEGIKENSLKQYKIAVNQLWNFCHKEINMVEYDDINAFLASFKASGCASQTVRNKYQSLSSIFSFMTEFHYILDNPINKIAPPKVDLTYEEPISRQEEERIKIVCERMKPKHSARALAIINFILDSGVRVSELCNIKISDVDFANREVHIKRGKGNKDRVVFFTDKTTVRIQEYFTHRTDVSNALFGNDVYLFANLRGEGKMSKGSVESMLNEVGMLANVPRLHPHLLRATFATRLVEKGVPINVVAEMLGHANLNTIDRYVHMSKKNKKDYYYRVV